MISQDPLQLSALFLQKLSGNLLDIHPSQFGIMYSNLDQSALSLIHFLLNKFGLGFDIIREILRLSKDFQIK